MFAVHYLPKMLTSGLLEGSIFSAFQTDVTTISPTWCLQANHSSGRCSSRCKATHAAVLWPVNYRCKKIIIKNAIHSKGLNYYSKFINSTTMKNK